MLRKTAIFIVVLMLLGTASLFAEKGQPTKKSKKVDLEGKLVCLGCDLKKAENARAECSVFGHKHVLKTDEGKYINFLENKFSKDLINGEKYNGKHIKIHGTYHESANLIDVETFAADDKTLKWCNHCEVMGSCSCGM